MAVGSMKEQRESAAMNETYATKCDEFEVLGLDSQSDPSLSEDRRRQVADHALVCEKCAALRDSWKAAKSELSALGEYTAGLNAPLRVEARLLQQFRLKHQFRKERKSVKFAVWALAAAALLLCTVSWWDWQHARHSALADIANFDGSSIAAGTAAESGGANVAAGSASATDDTSEMLLADNDTGEFTQLPGSSAQETEDAAIVRVGMQRGSLAALGLPVNEERASDWIQVDLLVASDGSPQAVRLPQ
jgi:hypothetical protein